VYTSPDDGPYLAHPKGDLTHIKLETAVGNHFFIYEGEYEMNRSEHVTAEKMATRAIPMDDVLAKGATVYDTAGNVKPGVATNIFEATSIQELAVNIAACLSGDVGSCIGQTATFIGTAPASTGFVKAFSENPNSTADLLRWVESLNAGEFGNIKAEAYAIAAVNRYLMEGLKNICVHNMGTDVEFEGDFLEEFADMVEHYTSGTRDTEFYKLVNEFVKYAVTPSVVESTMGDVTTEVLCLNKRSLYTHYDTTAILSNTTLGIVSGDIYPDLRKACIAAAEKAHTADVESDGFYVTDGGMITLEIRRTSAASFNTAIYRIVKIITS